MEIDYLGTLKSRITRHQWQIDHIRKVADKIDENFCCRHHGVPTWHLRCELGYPTSNHRLALKKLEKEGRVISYKQCENQILWWPVGLLQEIKAT